MIVTLQDARQLKMCSSGLRAFFMRHNLDWTEFLKNGIEEEKLAGIDDAMMEKVLEVARGRRG